MTYVLEALDRSGLYEQKGDSRPLTAVGSALLWRCMNAPEQAVPPTLERLWVHDGRIYTCLARLNLDPAMARSRLACEMRRPAFLEHGNAALVSADFDFLPDGDTFRALVFLDLPLPFQLFRVEPHVQIDAHPFVHPFVHVIKRRPNSRYAKRVHAKRRRAKRRRAKRRH